MRKARLMSAATARSDTLRGARLRLRASTAKSPRRQATCTAVIALPYFGKKTIKKKLRSWCAAPAAITGMVAGYADARLALMAIATNPPVRAHVQNNRTERIMVSRRCPKSSSSWFAVSALPSSVADP